MERINLIISAQGNEGMYRDMLFMCMRGQGRLARASVCSCMHVAAGDATAHNKARRCAYALVCGRGGHTCASRRWCRFSRSSRTYETRDAAFSLWRAAGGEGGANSRGRIGAGQRGKYEVKREMEVV
eukprot:2187400-Pleurochrysis_carterae.AAC.1